MAAFDRKRTLGFSYLFVRWREWEPNRITFPFLADRPPLFIASTLGPGIALWKYANSPAIAANATRVMARCGTEGGSNDSFDADD